MGNGRSGRQFSRGKVNVVICVGCGKKTTSGIDGAIDLALCRPCYEDSGMENEHSDGHHQDEADPNCRFCDMTARER